MIAHQPDAAAHYNTAHYEYDTTGDTATYAVPPPPDDAQAILEKRQESDRLFAAVIARQRARLRKPRVGSQVRNRKPQHPHRLQQGNANRWD